MIEPNFFAESLFSLYPNAQWHLQDKDYETLNWMSEDIPKPTLEEIEAEMQRLQAEWKLKEYQRLRAPEYPPLTKLADALYWNAKGDSSHLEAYYTSCDAVKNKYPKQ